MPPKTSGDYSKFPEAIRDAFQYIEGEVMDLRQSWDVYERLFMEDEDRSKLLGHQLGPLLIMFRNVLLNELFLGIARLTDKDSRYQNNLSLWALEPGAACSTSLLKDVQDILDGLAATSAAIRRHRNKRIAHFDLMCSLGLEQLPTVLHLEIANAIDLMEVFLNEFHWEFEQMTMRFGVPAIEITGAAEAASAKAATYDLLEKEGKIEHGECRRRFYPPKKK